MMLRTALLAAAALVAVSAKAAEPTGFTVTSGFISRHAGPKVYNERNAGVGLRIDQGTLAGWHIGSYRNSHGRTSVYVAREWLWQVAGPLRLGAVAGVATGYNGFVLPAALPEAVLRFGRFETALLVQPIDSSRSPAMVALQLRWSF